MEDNRAWRTVIMVVVGVVLGNHFVKWVSLAHDKVSKVRWVIILTNIVVIGIVILFWRFKRSIRQRLCSTSSLCCAILVRCWHDYDSTIIIVQHSALLFACCRQDR